jgi:hypothetical protein
MAATLTTHGLYPTARVTGAAAAHVAEHRVNPSRWYVSGDPDNGGTVDRIGTSATSQQTLTSRPAALIREVHQMPFGNKDKSENAKGDNPKKAELPKDLPARTPAGPRGKGGQGQGRG